MSVIFTFLPPVSISGASAPPAAVPAASTVYYFDVLPADFHPTGDVTVIVGSTLPSNGPAAPIGAVVAAGGPGGGGAWPPAGSGPVAGGPAEAVTSTAGPQQSTADVAAPVACFAAGTAIATPGGPRAVETLAPGDLVVSPWDEALTVVWIGHRRIACGRHPHPADVWPVRVVAHAFGPGMPGRDLLLSPDHAVFVAPPGSRPVLIPIRHLVNGTSVVQERAASVTYWHVELERHAVVLAEGLPAESYLDTGNRGAFAEAEGAVMLHADFAAGVWNAKACAPHVSEGPLLDGWRRRLARPAPPIHARVA